MRHVIVCKQDGRFAGWQANHGIWSWGNEIVVGFALSYFNVAGGFYAIDRSRRGSALQARSLDGGETWQVEDPGLCRPGADSPAVTLPDGINFTHPDVAIMFSCSGLTAGARSWFYVSYDRCRTWTGPVDFPMLGLPGISARTDFLPAGPDCYLFSLTAVKSNGDEGRTFCAQTLDSGKTFRFLSWVGPEPDGFTSSLRVTACRR